MKLKRSTTRYENKVTSTKYSWRIESSEIQVFFPSDVICIYSEKIDRVVADISEIDRIQLINVAGEVTNEYQTPSLNGYQFRGINRNNKSKAGISLLFFPTEESLRTEWNDMVQYELLYSKNPLGKKLGVYR